MKFDECEPGYGSWTGVNLQKCNTLGLLEGSKGNQTEMVTMSSRYPASGCWQYQIPDTAEATGNQDWFLGSREFGRRHPPSHVVHQ